MVEDVTKTVVEFPCTSDDAGYGTRRRWLTRASMRSLVRATCEAQTWPTPTRQIGSRLEEGTSTRSQAASHHLVESASSQVWWRYYYVLLRHNDSKKTRHVNTHAYTQINPEKKIKTVKRNGTDKARASRPALLCWRMEISQQKSCVVFVSYFVTTNDCAIFATSSTVAYLVLSTAVPIL